MLCNLLVNVFLGIHYIIKLRKYPLEFCLRCLRIFHTPLYFHFSTTERTMLGFFFFGKFLLAVNNKGDPLYIRMVLAAEYLVAVLHQRG